MTPAIKDAGARLFTAIGKGAQHEDLRTGLSRYQPWPPGRAAVSGRGEAKAARPPWPAPTSETPQASKASKDQGVPGRGHGCQEAKAEVAGAMARGSAFASTTPGPRNQGLCNGLTLGVCRALVHRRRRRGGKRGGVAKATDAWQPRSMAR